MGPLDQDLADVGAATRAELKDRWRRALGGEPPTWLSNDLLRRAVAHRAQLAATGRLTPAAVRQLRAQRTNDTGRRRLNQPAVGTRLVREWGGRTHVIDVVPAGFQWAGRTYRSLSEIARAITGARWSGPRFFGMGSGSATRGAS